MRCLNCNRDDLASGTEVCPNCGGRLFTPGRRVWPALSVALAALVIVVNACARKESDDSPSTPANYAAVASDSNPSANTAPLSEPSAANVAFAATTNNSAQQSSGENQSLPIVPHIVADPTLFPPDTRPIPYGDPKSTSSGPGRGGGASLPSQIDLGGGKGGGTDYTKPFAAKDVTRKAIITSKPEPGFTEEARQNNVHGVVVLRMVLGMNGQVSDISVIKGLPDGLTERAIAAAKRIQFVPAQKDGRNVSQWIRAEYNFIIKD